MAKIKVHVLAKELEMQSKDVLAFLQDKGIEAKAAQSAIEEDAADMVRKQFSKKASQAPVAEEVKKTPEAPAAAPAEAPAEGTTVKAPMPGTILKVNVQNGQKVEEGTVLMILEAMKMENEIMAPCAGTVTSVCVNQGAAVDSDAVLCTIA